ncbi:hypothetical protein CerSpe_289240 [Prunus speciosa]
MPHQPELVYRLNPNLQSFYHASLVKAFKNTWEMACSLPTRTRIVIPVGSTYLVHPVDIAGPCRSKVTLMISGNIVAPKDPDAWIGLNPQGGRINGMGQERSCKTNSTNPCRHAPTAVTSHKCKNLKVIEFQRLYYFHHKFITIVQQYIRRFTP